MTISNRQQRYNDKPLVARQKQPLACLTSGNTSKIFVWLIKSLKSFSIWNTMMKEMWINKGLPHKMFDSLKYLAECQPWSWKHKDFCNKHDDVWRPLISCAANTRVPVIRFQSWEALATRKHTVETLKHKAKLLYMVKLSQCSLLGLTFGCWQGNNNLGAK